MKLAKTWIIGLGAVGLAISAGAAAAQRSSYTTYHNERFGFSISYPVGVFKLEKETEDGRMMVSPDGRARLLFGAFENTGGDSLDRYRRQVLAQSYSGASLDYAPVRGRWFVLSGERDGIMFYERVTFTCGGQIINSWAMVYPVAERAFYDRLVEAVAKTYTPGAGRDGRCEFSSAADRVPRPDER
jgi:hypothetical protein